MLYDFNHTRPSETAKRQQIMQSLFADVGKNCYIEPPLHANWGIHSHLGNNVYANFNLTLVDDTHIYIGENSVIGAGSIVTKDIPPNVVAVGNPCSILREINQHDKEYYYKDYKISNFNQS